MTAHEDLASVESVLASIPDLPGAACKGRHREFDLEPDEKAAIKKAVAVCQNECPAFTDCRRWVAGLRPSARPCGVVAGRFYPPPKPRREQRGIPQARDPNSKQSAADRWLARYLRRHGTVPRLEVITAGQNAGHDRRFVRIASQRLGVIPCGDPPTWGLPQSRPKRPVGDQNPNPHRKATA